MATPNIVEGKTLLLTGGTGSFGTALTKIALTLNPKQLRILNDGEAHQVEMAKAFHDERLRFCLGNVRDEGRLERAMKGANYVIHAAAIKHVPTGERDPEEVIKTNIIGSMNVVDAAVECQVEKVLGLSTDKAVKPVNLYGGTKFVMEKLFMASNDYGKPRFSCTRYGNVVGSNGSVVPLFREQAKSGTLTITDPRMTRFWITLEQGVWFVLNCLERMKGGEIFVPKIPSMRITDLANLMGPGCVHNIIGNRGGEKIHESLLSEEEAPYTLDCESYYQIGQGVNNSLPDGFVYSSDTNSWYLTPDEMRALL